MSNAASILAGSNDTFLLHEVYRRCEPPLNPSQIRFVNAWELSSFLASSGFEILFEQDRSLDEFAQWFVDVGFPEAQPVFQKVKALVPDALLADSNEEELQDYLEENFDRLKELFYEYLDVAENRLLPALGEFVRRHRKDFAKQLATA